MSLLYAGRLLRQPTADGLQRRLRDERRRIAGAAAATVDVADGAHRVGTPLVARDVGGRSTRVLDDVTAHWVVRGPDGSR